MPPTECPHAAGPVRKLDKFSVTELLCHSPLPPTFQRPGSVVVDRHLAVRMLTSKPHTKKTRTAAQLGNPVGINGKAQLGNPVGINGKATETEPPPIYGQGPGANTAATTTGPPRSR
jgi:hypothetical protein